MSGKNNKTSMASPAVQANASTAAASQRSRGSSMASATVSRLTRLRSKSRESNSKKSLAPSSLAGKAHSEAAQNNKNGILTNRSDFISRFRKAKPSLLGHGTTPGPVSGPSSILSQGSSSGNRSLGHHVNYGHLWNRKQNERPSSLSSSPDNASVVSSSSTTSSRSGSCPRCREFSSLHIGQDLVGIKTQLHRLRRVLQDAETRTATPSNATTVTSSGLNSPSLPLAARSLFDELGSMPEASLLGGPVSLNTHEDVVSDLKRQIVLLQQQNEEKDRQIRVLERRLEDPNPAAAASSATSSKSSSKSPDKMISKANAATQTDRISRPVSCGVSMTTTLSDAGSELSTTSSSGHSSEPRNPDGRKLRRSRTPLPRRVILCSEDGTLRIPIRTTAIPQDL